MNGPQLWMICPNEVALEKVIFSSELTFDFLHSNHISIQFYNVHREKNKEIKNLLLHYFYVSTNKLQKYKKPHVWHKRIFMWVIAEVL